MTIAQKFAWAQSLITGVALEDSSEGLPVTLYGTDHAAHVATPTDHPLAVSMDETTGLTTTIVRKSIPTGARMVTVGLYPSTKAAADAALLYFVPNALSDSDEDVKMTTAGLRFVVPVGTSQAFVFPASTPCTRYAIATNVASETVGNICVQIIGANL